MLIILCDGSMNNSGPCHTGAVCLGNFGPTVSTACKGDAQIVPEPFVLYCHTIAKKKYVKMFVRILFLLGEEVASKLASCDMAQLGLKTT